ncbi:MAG TPA: phosphatidylglycerophosphatase A [Gammaproteobacteria bacterium]|nr:phosphatidylglycerophosphatase A [Gammaproteobacteria bacterium]
MSKNSAPSSVWRNPIHFLAFGFGSGAMPFAPGTFGTLAALPVYLLMQPLNLWAYLTVVVVMLLVGIWLCHVTSRDLGVHDHAGIVWDEIVGYLITMIAAPSGWQWMVAGFVLFRFFDIIKPWPIGWVDRRVHGGLGIMLDDVLAGVLAWAVLQGGAWVL